MDGLRHQIEASLSRSHDLIMEDRYRQLQYEPIYYAYLHPPEGANVSGRLRRHLPMLSRKKSKSKGDTIESPAFFKRYHDKYGSVSAHSTSAIYGALREPYLNSVYLPSEGWYASVRSLNGKPRDVVCRLKAYDWQEPIYEDVARESLVDNGRTTSSASASTTANSSSVPCGCGRTRRHPTSYSKQHKALPNCTCCSGSHRGRHSCPLIPPLPVKRKSVLPEKVNLRAVTEEIGDDSRETNDDDDIYSRVYDTARPVSSRKATVPKFVKALDRRDPSPSASSSRKSILECDVTAYDLIKKSLKSSVIPEVDSDIDDDLSDNAVNDESINRRRRHEYRRTPKRRESITSVSSTRNGRPPQSCSNGVSVTRSMDSHESYPIYEPKPPPTPLLPVWNDPISSEEPGYTIPEPDYDNSDDSELEEIKNESLFNCLRVNYSPPPVKKAWGEEEDTKACPPKEVPFACHPISSHSSSKGETRSMVIEKQASRIPVRSSRVSDRRTVKTNNKDKSPAVEDSGQSKKPDIGDIPTMPLSNNDEDSRLPQIESCYSSELKSILKRGWTESADLDGADITSSAQMEKKDLQRKKQVMFKSREDNSIIVEHINNSVIYSDNDDEDIVEEQMERAEESNVLEGKDDDPTVKDYKEAQQKVEDVEMKSSAPNEGLPSRELYSTSTADYTSSSTSSTITIVESNQNIQTEHESDREERNCSKPEEGQEIQNANKKDLETNSEVSTANTNLCHADGENSESKTTTTRSGTRSKKRKSKSFNRKSAAQNSNKNSVTQLQKSPRDGATAQHQSTLHDNSVENKVRRKSDSISFNSNAYELKANWTVVRRKSTSLDDLRKPVSVGRDIRSSGESTKAGASKNDQRPARGAPPKRRFSDLGLHLIPLPFSRSATSHRQKSRDGAEGEETTQLQSSRSLPESPVESKDISSTFCFEFWEKTSRGKVASNSRSTFYVQVDSENGQTSEGCPVNPVEPTETAQGPSSSSDQPSQPADDIEGERKEEEKEDERCNLLGAEATLSSNNAVAPSVDNDNHRELQSEQIQEVVREKKDEAEPGCSDGDKVTDVTVDIPRATIVVSDEAVDDSENIYEIVDPIYEELPDLDDTSLKSIGSPAKKSFFEGASKTDILSYLEDAKERGLENLEEEDQVIIEDEEDDPELNKRLITNNTQNHATSCEKITDSGDPGGTNQEISGSADSLKMVRSPSAEVERNDSGVGTETSKPQRLRRLIPAGSEEQLCADCDQQVEPMEDEQSGLLFSPLVCKKCDKKRCERKEIILEFVDTELKYGRDLRIVKEEFNRPMEIAGLLTKEQLDAVFLNLDELLGFNCKFSEKLQDALDIAGEQGDEDYTTVNIGKLFGEVSPMLHAFETYCVRHASGAVVLSNLEKEKELLRIFLRVSQMENTLLRRMNLPAFLMVPVQRVTKYPLLLSRLYKVTPYHHQDREALREVQQKVELHLEHINQQTKGVGGTKIWRRISNISASHRRLGNLEDIGNITLRKMALEVLKWNSEDVRFVMAGRLFYTQQADCPWSKRGKTLKFSPVHALLLTLGKPNSNYRPETVTENCILFPRNTGITDATLLLMKQKNGRFTVVRDPLHLGSCVISCDPDSEDVFEVQECTTKEAYVLKGENKTNTREWLKQLRYHAKDLGAWRRRRNALSNIMINGMTRQ